MSTEADRPAEQPWFGIRVRSRSEQMAALGLESRGYRPFLPASKVLRRWSDRTREVEVPLFPGYVFCRFDPQRRLPILTTPGVLGVVGFGNAPAPIDAAEIEAIQAVVAAGLTAQPCSFTREGDSVSVIAGPLRGMRGVVHKVKNNRQLILSITMLQRAVSVDVDAAWVTQIH